MPFPNKYMQRAVKVRIRRNQKPHRRVVGVADAYPRMRGELAVGVRRMCFIEYGLLGSQEFKSWLQIGRAHV